MASRASAVLDVTETKDVSSVYNDCDPASVHSNESIYNSIIQSPSLESFSTINDIGNLSELNMDENADLCVKIDNPQKHLETMETFITFRITTRVARIEFDDNEYIVRRRYNDFIWLRHQLLDCHPFCIIPPLPGKHSLMGQLDRYSKEFIIVRMKALNVFLNRVVQHPILSCNSQLQVFLTAKQSDFNMHRKQRISSNDPHKRSSGATPTTSTHSTLKTRHLEFDKAKTYLTQLSEKLNSIEKISSRINKERSDFISELNSFYPVFSNWAGSEPKLADSLQNVASALERNSNAQSALVNSYANSVGNPIRDFLAYIDVVQETLRKRESYQYAYELSMQELNKRHNEKDKLVAVQQQNPQANGGGFSLWKQPSCDDKLEKLGTYIPQLLKKVESHQDDLECANESLRSDLARWQSEKQHSLKNILLQFVNRQIEYHQTSVNAWEHVTDEIMQQNTVQNNSSMSS